MRRKYSLYINGTLADIATDALVLMNYKQTDATAPAAVYNSWSQSVVLPRTSKNNAIFDHIFRADHKTTSGKFNALARTPFTIYNEQGEILESGYLKLTDKAEFAVCKLRKPASWKSKQPTGPVLGSLYLKGMG